MSNAAALAKIQEAEKELAQLEAVYAELATDASLTAASMAPPPVGTVADVVSIGKSLWKGDWGGALLDTVGLVPIAGDAIKGGIKGTKIANKMKDVEIALKAAHVKLLQKKSALKTDPKDIQKKTAEACKKGRTEQCPKMGGTKPYSNSKTRPAYGKGQVDEVWGKAKQPDGNVYDPNTGEKLEWDKEKSRAGQWDMGHNSGKEYRKSHKDYMDGEITKEEFLKEYRDPNNYKPEAPSSNRSGQFEER